MFSAWSSRLWEFEGRRAIFLAAALLFGAFVFALLPPSIVALNDDFAYLRAVVETLQRGRLWTDDWLEPWSAGLSAVSALAFVVTRSFYAATYGVMALCAAWTFLVGCLLLERRGASAMRAIVVTTVAVTLPTVFWKQVQFTGLVLYLPCLLTALWAVERRRWIVFGIVWVLAFSTRQSAIVWVLLPLWSAFAGSWRERRMPDDWHRIAGVLASGAVVFALLAATMPKTAAQAAISDHLFTQWDAPHALRVAGIAAVVFLILRGLALGATAQWAELGTSRAWVFRLGTALGLAVVWWLWIDPREVIGCEFATYGGAAGLLYLRVVGMLAIAAACLGASVWRCDAVLVAAAATGLLTLRPMLWDYYFLEVAVFGAWSTGTKSNPVRSAPAWRVAWSAGALLAMGAFHGWGVVHAKSVLDRTRVMTDLGTRAVESGHLAPADASVLPFGLMAWYFFPLYAAHEGKGSANLADFGCYLAHDTTLVAWKFSRSLRRLPEHRGGIPDEPSGAPIIRGKFPYFWIYEVEVLLYRNAPDQVKPSRVPYPADYRVPRFPRDDADWKELIRSGR